MHSLKLWPKITNAIERYRELLIETLKRIELEPSLDAKANRSTTIRISEGRPRIGNGLEDLEPGRELAAIEIFQMKKPTDTTKNLNLISLMALAIGTDAFHLQERQGQREAVESESLPTPGDLKIRKEYEALGFIFGDPFEDDKLFCPVEMPKGWSKRKTEHAMHNDIVDANGNRRGSFFYKAVVYDRSATLYSPEKRYIVRRRPDADSSSDDDYDRWKILRFDVIDNVTENVLFSSEHMVDRLSPDKGGDRREWWNESDRLEKLAKAECRLWLTENFPDNENPAAYWPE